VDTKYCMTLYYAHRRVQIVQETRTLVLRMVGVLYDTLNLYLLEPFSACLANLLIIPVISDLLVGCPDTVSNT
jgi:hypothetical protein